MENRDLARLLRETADLMEIAGEQSFRIRSYRKAADAVENCPESLAGLGAAADPKRLQAIPGVGARLSEQLHAALNTGSMPLHQELLQRFHPEMLRLLEVPGLGPKTIALIWSTCRAGSPEEVEQLARAGRLRTLPRMSATREAKILEGIVALHGRSGRVRRDQAEEIVALQRPVLQDLPGVAQLTVEGGLRRGCETIASLDWIATGTGFGFLGVAEPVLQRFSEAPRVIDVIERDARSCTVRLYGGLRSTLTLARLEQAGAARLAASSAPAHFAALQQRAQAAGYALDARGLARGGEAAESAAEEADVYRALGLPWIAPELREGAGELEAAAAGTLPTLIEEHDIRGDLHMHTSASDGRATILEMAEAAAARGYGYIAITDHSQALAMARGLNEERMLEQRGRIRAAEAEFQRRHPGFRILAGVEVDILADGRLDLADEVLAQLDVVIGSVHSRFDQPEAETTARLLRAVANPNLDILGHPTGRLLLRRDPYRYDFEAVIAACAAAGVAMEINAAPERLDLGADQVRRARAAGVGIVINTDAHAPRQLNSMRHGIAVARRAGLEAAAVWNTRPAEALLAGLR